MSLTYKNILVAVDGSEQADWALKKAMEMAKRNHANLHIVHVYEVRVYPSDYSSIKERAKNEGSKLLEKYKLEAEENGLNANTILEEGSPKVVISKKVAVDIDADIIVCGASGLYAVEQILLGSVTDSIIRTAKCDVLVVRERSKKS